MNKQNEQDTEGGGGYYFENEALRNIANLSNSFTQ